MELPDEITLNHLEEQALLAVQGPKAAAALERVVPGVSDLVFMQGKAFVWERRDLWISRSGYTGEDGFEISLPGEAAEAFADAICAQPEVKPIGLGARDSLRLEAGLPLYGHDLDTETTPVMADLGFALSKRRREAGRLSGPRADHGRARTRSGREARRPAGRGPPAGARRRRRGRWRRVGSRQGHLRRVRAERRGARSRWPMSRWRWPNPAPRSRSSSATRFTTRRSRRCRSSPTAISEESS